MLLMLPIEPTAIWHWLLFQVLGPYVVIQGLLWMFSKVRLFLASAAATLTAPMSAVALLTALMSVPAEAVRLVSSIVRVSAIVLLIGVILYFWWRRCGCSALRT
jgi:hypothetical protein